MAMFDTSWSGSKHAAPSTGRVKIDRHSSLRKLMRAARRGMIPDERQTMIDTALAQARKRAEVYRTRALMGLSFHTRAGCT